MGKKNSFDDDFDIFNITESDSDNKDSISTKTNKRSIFKGIKNKKIIGLSIVILLIVIFIECYIILSDYLKNDDVLNEDSVIEKPNEIEPSISEKDKSVESEIFNKSSLYAFDLNSNETYLNLGLISKDGITVPVTLVLNKDKILKDFGLSDINEITYLDLYKKYSSSLNLSNLGLVNYHPLSENLSEIYRAKDDGFVFTGSEIKDDYNNYYKGLKFEMDETSINKYDVSTDSFELLKSSLINTFSSMYDEIHFTDKSGVPYTFNTAGFNNSLLFLNENNNGSGYYVYNLNKETRYLTSDFLSNSSESDIFSVLDNMKNVDNDLYKSIIPKGIDFDIELNGCDLYITFKEQLSLSDYSSTEMLSLIEGICLTAKSFNYNLYLKNIKETYWQGFDFSKSLPIPLGANKIYVN